MIKRQNHHSRIFCTKKSTPFDNKVVEFQNALYKIIANIKFNTYDNKFQNKLIESLNKLFVIADEPNDLYKVDKENYLKDRVSSAITNSLF